MREPSFSRADSHFEPTNFVLEQQGPILFHVAVDKP
jgi:hypothetical protein